MTRMNLTIDIPLHVLAREPGGFPAVLVFFLRLDSGRMYPGSLCAVKYGLHTLGSFCVDRDGYSCITIKLRSLTRS